MADRNSFLSPSFVINSNLLLPTLLAKLPGQFVNVALVVEIARNLLYKKNQHSLIGALNPFPSKRLYVTGTEKKSYLSM